MSGYLGNLGDLLPREIFGDFLPTQSSLSSMSLESEQLQLSIMADIRLLPYISSEGRKEAGCYWFCDFCSKTTTFKITIGFNLNIPKFAGSKGNSNNAPPKQFGAIWSTLLFQWFHFLFFIFHRVCATVLLKFRSG